MGNRNNIRRFPAKKGNIDQLRAMVSTIADGMVASFNEMIGSKLDALNWAIDQLPEMERAAGLPDIPFATAEGIFPFLLSGFFGPEDEEEDELGISDFGGIYPCFSADEDLPAGVEEYILFLVVSGEEDEDPENESHRIDAFLARRDSNDDMFAFDGEDWIDFEDLVGDDEDDDILW